MMSNVTKWSVFQNLVTLMMSNVTKWSVFQNLVTYIATCHLITQADYVALKM